MATQDRAARDIDVFISYKREERPLATQVAGALEAAGYTQVTDLNLANSTHFGDEIDRLIRRARVVLVLWTAASIASDWVRSEARLGRDLGTYLGVMVEPVELPVDLRTLQAEVLDAPLIASLPRIVGALAEMIGPAQETAAAATGQSASLNDDLMLFQTARDAASTTSYRAYLNRFPRGVMADEARRWIAQAEKDEARRSSVGHRLRSALPTTAAIGTAIAAGGLLLNYLTADLPWRNRAADPTPAATHETAAPEAPSVQAPTDGAATARSGTASGPAAAPAVAAEAPSRAQADRQQPPPPDCTTEDSTDGYRFPGPVCVPVKATRLGGYSWERDVAKLAAGFSDADLRKVAGLPNLQRLILDGTQVSDLAPPASLTGLEWLSLSLRHAGDRFQPVVRAFQSA